MRSVIVVDALGLWGLFMRGACFELMMGAYFSALLCYWWLLGFCMRVW